MPACSKGAAGKRTCLACCSIDEIKVIAPGGLVSLKGSPAVLHRVVSVDENGVVAIEDPSGSRVLSRAERDTLMVARRGIPDRCRVVARQRILGSLVLFAVKA